jgi:hypothetical protein
MHPHEIHLKKPELDLLNLMNQQKAAHLHRKAKDQYTRTIS